MTNSEKLEELLGAPYWVIDVLPVQVPKDSAGRFFAVERYWLEGPQAGQLRQRFLNVLLKLNCYVGLLVVRGESDDWARNPAPNRLAAWVNEPTVGLSMLVDGQDTLITLGDDINMTLYNPSEELLSLVQQLAQSEGLFVWQPPQNMGDDL